MGSSAALAIAKFYESNGPCCAGCDHWRFYNSVVGDCTRTAPVSGPARVDMLGIVGPSIRIQSGYIMTPRAHVFGEFVDTPGIATPPGDK